VVNERRTACTASLGACRGVVEQESARRGGGNALRHGAVVLKQCESRTCVLCEEHFHAPQLCTAYDCRRWKCLTRPHGERDKGAGKRVPHEDGAVAPPEVVEWPAQQEVKVQVEGPTREEWGEQVITQRS
jgi:hypothetical protein